MVSKIMEAILFAFSGGREDSSSAIADNVYDFPLPLLPAMRMTCERAMSSQILFEREV